MSYFLLVYNRRTGEVDVRREYPQARRKDAIRDRFAEERAAQDDPDVEVVVLSGESREALERTHGRYFHSVSDLAANAKID